MTSARNPAVASALSSSNASRGAECHRLLGGVPRREIGAAARARHAWPILIKRNVLAAVRREGSAASEAARGRPKSSTCDVGRRLAASSDTERVRASKWYEGARMRGNEGALSRWGWPTKKALSGD